MAETPPVFALGVAGPPQPREKKRRLAKPATTTDDSMKPLICRFTPYPWLLTNPKNFNAMLVIIQAVDSENEAYTSIVPILEFLKRELQRQKVKYPARINFPGTVKEILINICDAIQHVKNNQRQIMAFRALAHKWLLKSRFKAGNDEDLLTGEVPKRAVTLTVWSERCKYSFEANTIRRDMIERLFQHFYLFPKYLMPRNPYTNCEMTHYQFSNVINQLRAFGLSHWAFEGLLACKYNIDKFKAMFGEAFKRELILKHFSNLSSPETIEIVFDFIEDQHKENEKYFDRVLYRWTLENNNRCFKIKKWVAQCKRYHESVVNIHDRMELGKILIDINKVCSTFCSYPFELEEFRNEERKKQGLPPILLAHAEPDTESEGQVDVNDNLILQFTNLYINNEIAIIGGDETPSTEAESS